MRRILCLAFLLALSSPAWAENWPMWRGPTGMGVSSEKNLPVRWSNSENVKWKVPLEGAGVGTPVIWNDRVFLTASSGRRNDRLHVQGFRRSDGKMLWHTRLLGTSPTDMYPPGGMAVPTPATDGKLLFVLFGTGDLAALDLEGRPVWIRSLAEEYGPFRNRWGMGSSPILVDGTLLVQVDHWSRSYLLAVDAATGRNRWKADRDASVNWTSPLPIDRPGGKQVVVFGTEIAKGYDLRDGKELWQVKGMHFQCIPSPVLVGQDVVATSGVGSLGIRLDDSRGDLTATHIRWTNSKATAFLPSPVVLDDLVYLPGDRNFLTCLDGKTGKQIYKERLRGTFYASPVAGDGKLYVANKEGTVFVLKAGRDFEVLYENDMAESIVASPAISGGAIFLRGEKHLFCIENR